MDNVTIKTSNENVSIDVSYNSIDEIWSYQLICKELRLPIIKHKIPLEMVDKDRDNMLIKQLVQNDFERKEASKLIHEIQVEANSGKTKAYLYHLVLKNLEIEDEDFGFEEELAIEDKYSANIIEQANDILENGDAIEYIMDTWRAQHAGDDDTSGYSTLFAFASTFMLNSNGVHVKAGGPAGFGKSTGITKMLGLMPPERVRIQSMTGKSVFYDKSLKPGMLLYLDDIDLSKPDLLTTIKQSTSTFQQETNHHTVVNGTSVKCGAPERISWVMSAVNGFDDEQLSSRFLHTEVIPDLDYATKINHKQMENDNSYSTVKDPSVETLICRCIFDIIGQDLYKIVTPFMKEGTLIWVDVMNTRNYPMFHDIVLGVTLFNLKNREKFHDFYISTIEDFYKAKEIYQKLAKINSTKLSDKEIKTLEILSTEFRKIGSKKINGSIHDGKVDRNELAQKLSLTSVGAKNILHGQKNDGGLLLKVQGLFDEKAQVEINGKKITKCFYWYTGCISNGSTDFVSVDETKVADDIAKWKEGYVEDLKLKGRL